MQIIIRQPTSAPYVPIVADECPTDHYPTGVTSGGQTRCSACSNLVCSPGQKRTGTCGAKLNDNNYQCTACAQCRAGQFIVKGCTTSTDTACSACWTCPSGQYRTSKCTRDRDTQCETCSNSNCQKGVQFRVGTCADTTNGYTCAMCGSLTCRPGTSCCVLWIKLPQCTIIDCDTSVRTYLFLTVDCCGESRSPISG